VRSSVVPQIDRSEKVGSLTSTRSILSVLPGCDPLATISINTASPFKNTDHPSVHASDSPFNSCTAPSVIDVNRTVAPSAPGSPPRTVPLSPIRIHVTDASNRGATSVRPRTTSTLARGEMSATGSSLRANEAEMINGAANAKRQSRTGMERSWFNRTLEV